jgi:HlyD family secretion protein
LAVTQQTETVNKAEKTFADAEQRLDETTLRAPIDGIVTEVIVRKGEKVQSATTGFQLGTPLMKLADISKLKVVAQVDEADYGRVVEIAPPGALPQNPLQDPATRAAEDLERRSGKVTLTVDTFPDESFDGVIERIEPQGRANLGSSTVIQFQVHVEITDPQRYRLPLGAQAQVEFTVQSVTNALVVAADAVKTHEDKQGLWLVTPKPAGEQRAGERFVRCIFGISDGESTEIVRTLDGEELKEGTEVYTKRRVKPQPKD